MIAINIFHRECRCFCCISPGGSVFIPSHVAQTVSQHLSLHFSSRPHHNSFVPFERSQWLLGGNHRNSIHESSSGVCGRPLAD